MTFGVLTVIVLAGLGGPLLSASERILVPVVVGELLAGLLIGRTGFHWIHPADPTLAFMAAIGFAMLMFGAGMKVPLRTPQLGTRLVRGAIAAAIAGVFAAIAGVAAAKISGLPHGAVYAVVLASGSAAVLVPSLQEANLLERKEGLIVAAQVSVADVAAIVAVPLALSPAHALRALLGACAVAVCAVALYFGIRRRRQGRLARPDPGPLEEPQLGPRPAAVADRPVRALLAGAAIRRQHPDRRVRGRPGRRRRPGAEAAFGPGDRHRQRLLRPAVLRRPRCSHRRAGARARLADRLRGAARRLQRRAPPRRGRAHRGNRSPQGWRRRCSSASRQPWPRSVFRPASCHRARRRRSWRRRSRASRSAGSASPS